MTQQLLSQRKKIFKTAWTILKAGSADNLSIALKKAWVICKVSLGIPTTINFAKAETGELRTANAIQTGSFDTIKDGYIRFVELADGKANWKSFRIANLLIA